MTTSNIAPNIDEAEPLGPGDAELINDLRRVLEAHDASHRFGISLLHKHFDLDEGEILVEDADVDARVLTSGPVHRQDAEMLGRLVETSWDISGEPTANSYCLKMDDGGHIRVNENA